MMSPNGPRCSATGVRITTHAAMQDLGRQLAALLRAGDLVILAGPLGAGKTTLVQGIGEGLAEGLAEDRLEISIQPDVDSEVRTVRLTGHGTRWNAMPACPGAGQGYPESS